jgi:guanylate kinase
VTTRPRRGSEIDGVHYQFKSHREFERMRDSEALLEWAEVHGNFYGTPREAAEVAMAKAATCCSTSTGRARSNCRKR